MNVLIDISSFEPVEEDVIFEHIYDLYINHKPRDDQHLGYVDKSKNIINLTCADHDLTIKQSLSSLNSNSQSSSTGFICWQTTSFLVDWILTNPLCPFYSIFKDAKLRNNLSILELGTGISSIIASIIGPRTKNYIATDQKHILKLSKENFNNNVVSNNFSSSTLNKKAINSVSNSTINFIDFDWEFPEQGLLEYFSLSDHEVMPDLIIACDTIYNDYLISPFLNTCKKLLNDVNGILVGIQLRDEGVMETFLHETLKSKLKLYYIPINQLSNDLVNGFVVYYIVK